MVADSGTVGQAAVSVVVASSPLEFIGGEGVSSSVELQAEDAVIVRDIGVAGVAV